MLVILQKRGNWGHLIFSDQIIKAGVFCVVICSLIKEVVGELYFDFCEGIRRLEFFGEEPKLELFRLFSMDRTERLLEVTRERTHYF